MASFYAELHVEGRVYVVVRCRFATQQSTGQRGRADAKVRLGPLEVELERDADDYLVLAAATPYAPKSGHVVFFDTRAKSARETIAFTGGHVVGLHEFFGPNSAGETAYRCTLTITADKFELLPGAPANLNFIRPAPGSHGKPTEALRQVPFDLSPQQQPAPQVEPAPQVAPRVAPEAPWWERLPGPGWLGTAALTALLTLWPRGLNAGERQFPPGDPAALRLAELERRHYAGEALSADEAEELRELLWKVRGIHLPATHAGTLEEQLKAAKLRALKPDFENVHLAGDRKQAIGEFDGVHMGEKLFIENKSAKKLYAINPKTGRPAKTPAQWADDQIYIKTTDRINALRNATGTYPPPCPDINHIRNFRRLHFRIEADDPQLRAAVDDAVKRLQVENPGWDFTTEFGHNPQANH